MSAYEWLTRAQHFVSGAISLISVPSPNGPSVGLLAWQGTEDSLKALVAGGSSIPKSHDLSGLMSHIEANNLCTPSQYSELAVSVSVVTNSGNYNDIRFPENDPKFWEQLPAADLRQRVEAAKAVCDLATRIVTSGAAVRASDYYSARQY